MTPTEFFNRYSSFIVYTTVLTTAFCAGIDAGRAGAAPQRAATIFAPVKETPANRQVRVDPRHDSPSFRVIVLAPANSEYTEARGIDAGGDITGFYQPNFESHFVGFFFGADQSDRTINIPEMEDTFLLRVADDGTMLGTSRSHDGRFHGLIVHDGQYEIIDPANGVDTVLTGIRPDNIVTGYTFTTPAILSPFSARINPSDFKSVPPFPTDNGAIVPNPAIWLDATPDSFAALGTVDRIGAQIPPGSLVDGPIVERPNPSITYENQPGIPMNLGDWNDPRAFITGSHTVTPAPLSPEAAPPVLNGHDINSSGWIVGSMLFPLSPDGQIANNKIAPGPRLIVPDLILGFVAIPAEK